MVSLQWACLFFKNRFTCECFCHIYYNQKAGHLLYLSQLSSHNFIAHFTNITYICCVYTSCSYDAGTQFLFECLTTYTTTKMPLTNVDMFVFLKISIMYECFTTRITSKRTVTRMYIVVSFKIIQPFECQIFPL